MKDWAGWREVKDILGKRCSNAFKGVIIEDCINKFALLCQDAAMVDQYPRDANRRKELFDQGYTIGNCSGHRCNCLADSLLQLLLHHGVLKGPGGSLAIEKWRHDMCQQVRRHLNEHVDEAMRPHDRNDSHAVLDVPDDVHACAFLQHHRHAQEIINYFVADSDFPRSFRVIVFFVDLMV